MSDKESELVVTCHYDGAPSYRIDLKAPDFKTAEDAWTNATQACIEVGKPQAAQQRLRGSEMARQMMQKCKDCGYHSLSTCPQCGGVSQAAAP